MQWLQACAMASSVCNGFKRAMASSVCNGIKRVQWLQACAMASSVLQWLQRVHELNTAHAKIYSCSASRRAPVPFIAHLCDHSMPFFALVLELACILISIFVIHLTEV